MSGSESFRRIVITPRDQQVVRLVYEIPLVTRGQLFELVFRERVGSAAGQLAERNTSPTKAKDRLRAMVQYHFLDALPRRHVSESYRYYLSSRAVRGLQLLREMEPEQEITPYRPLPSKLPHLVALTAIRVALLLACRASGYQLEAWRSEYELLAPLSPFGFLPDAFCRIGRTVDGVHQTAGFFIEAERSSKSTADLRAKIAKLGRFYYEHTDRYVAEFGTRSLRTLYLITSDYGLNPTRHVERLATLCGQERVGFIRMTTLPAFLSCDPAELFRAVIWRRSDEAGVCSLL